MNIKQMKQEFRKLENKKNLSKKEEKKFHDLALMIDFNNYWRN